jgi:hypothetical protein
MAILVPVNRNWGILTSLLQGSHAQFKEANNGHGLTMGVNAVYKNGNNVIRIPVRYVYWVEVKSEPL